MTTTTYKLKKDSITGNWYVQGLERGKGSSNLVDGWGAFVVPGTIGSRDKAINCLKSLKG